MTNRLHCRSCSGKNLNQMVNCANPGCGLERRQLSLNTGPRSTILASCLVLLGLVLSAGPALVLLARLSGTPFWLIGIFLLLAGLLGLLGLFLILLGGVLLFGSQTSLITRDEVQDRALLSLNLWGRVMGGHAYTGIRSCEPELPAWTAEISSASLLVVQPSPGVSDDARDNAADVLQAALLSLLAQGQAELWTAETETWLLGRSLRQARRQIFFRPGAASHEPASGLEDRLLKLLRNWQRASRPGRGPVGLSLADLTDELFEGQRVRWVKRQFCDLVRRESPWLRIAEGGQFFLVADRQDERGYLLRIYQQWYAGWQQNNPELALQLAQQAESALARREPAA